VSDRNIQPPDSALAVAISLLEPRMRTLLSESLRIPSVSGKEEPFTRFISDRLRSSGFIIDLWETDESQLGGYPVARARHLPLAGRPTLVAKLKGTAAGKSLLFNAHSDVVPAPHPERWILGPWDGHEKLGKYFGRGACDVKGALISAIWAMLAIKHAHPAGLPGELMLELVPGEEDCVTLGTLTSVVRGHTADACIVLEPTESLPRNASRPGLRFEITCHGKAVHGTVKWLGEDAIQLANGVLSILNELEKSWNCSPRDPYFRAYPIARPVTVDTVRGGEWQGMVCDSCLVAGYLELLPADEPAAWMDRFNLELAKLLDLRGLDRRNVTVEFVEQYDGHRLDSASELCRTAQKSVEFGTDLAQNRGSGWAGWTGFNSGCEAGLRAKMLNTPTLVWGPGSLAQAHAVDEFVEFSQVRLAAERFARFAVDWCR
jgi:acetylornithine deacetylase